MTRLVRNQHRIPIAAPADVAFMFFTPAGERLWVDGWDPCYIHPPTGETRAGMVFTTGRGNDFTIWQLADFDRTTRRARYVRTTPALRTGFVEVRCLPLDSGNCEAVIGYDLTALSPEGERSLDAYEGRAYAAMIDGWAKAIGARLPDLLRAQLQ